MIRATTLALALAAGTASLAAEPPDYQSEAENWGRLNRIVRPEYPAQALSNGTGGKVELRGMIRPDGYLDEIELVPDVPASSVFVDALKGLVKEWRFVPALGNDCQPILMRVKVEVSFEVENGKPHIFVTHQSLEKSDAPRPSPLAHFKPLKRVEPHYPISPLQRGIVADVFARVVVDRSGKVTAVTSTAYSPQRGVRENWLYPFTKEADTVLAEWQFPAVPDSARAPWIGCWTIKFRIPQ